MSATRDDAFWEIERISKFHVRNHFDCGEPVLNIYLAQHARQNDERNIGRTFVAVRPGKRKVDGYYTINSGSLEFENLTENLRKGLPRYPIPTVTLARLAVDSNAQGQRLGEELLLHGLRSVCDINSRVAVLGVFVIAKHDKAKKFYKKYGFTSLPDHPFHLIRFGRGI